MPLTRKAAGSGNGAPQVKSAEEVEGMRLAGRLAASVLEMIGPYVVPGVSTGELDARCHRFIVEDLECRPAPLNYRPTPEQPPFPRSICTSVNHVVCHGIPAESKVLRTGDVVNIDVTVVKDGWHGDTSKMFFVGEPGVLAQRLVRICQECLYKGIEQVRPGAALGDIGAAVQHHAERHRYSVVREYGGHGIGRVFHEAPQVLHYGKRGVGPRLAPGMTFTIEPMINAGKPAVKTLRDRWTVVTRDRRLSAQWEHTVLVTDDGAEVLTRRREETAFAQA